MYLVPADFDIESLDPGEAVAIDWSEQQYFSDQRTMSRSDILYVHDDPEGFHESRKGNRKEPRESRSMELGTLVHIRLLEPERWAKMLAPPVAAPAWWIGDQAAWSRHREITIQHNPGCIDASDGLVAEANAIAERMMQNKFVASIIGLPGPTELTIVWREPTTHVLCRVRLDKLGFCPDGSIAVHDLKTARSVTPHGFGKAMLERRYHVQAALYSDATAALFPGREVVYAIIAVRNRKHYKVNAGPVAERAIELGREFYLETLHDYARRLEQDDWLEPWENDDDHEIDLPERAYRGR